MANVKKINEIFYSLQGEGRNAGRAAVFVRFSGCNLRCSFCDTKHQDGKLMTIEEIVNEITKYPARLVILTGGEPTLFIDDELLDKIHAIGKEIAIETNGTRKVNQKIDFVTLSPKFEFTENAQLSQTECDELKIIFNSENDMSLYDSIKARYKYIQPCATDDEDINQENIINAIRYVRENPEWRLSLQIQKIINIK